MKESYEDRIEKTGPTTQNGLAETINRYKRHWYWFVLCAILGVSIAFLKLRFTTPMYKTQAQILVNGNKSGTSATTDQSGFGGDFGVLLGGPSSVDNEAEIIKTRYLMEQVVQALNEQVTIFRPDRLGDVELHPKPLSITLLSSPDSIRGGVFSVEIHDEKRGTISHGDEFSNTFLFGEKMELPGVGRLIIEQADPAIPVARQVFKVSVKALDSRVSDFMGKLSVSIKSNLVSVIDLSFDYPLPKKGEYILNKMIQVYMANNLANKNAIADSTIAFVDSRLDIVEKELYQIEQKIQSFRQSHSLANMPAQSQLLLESSTDYVKRLAEIETQLSILSDVEGYLTNENNTRVLPNAVVTGDVVFNTLIERYNELLLERGRRLLNATPENPSIVNLDEQLNGLRQDMLANLRSTQSRLTITKGDLERKTRQLDSEVKDIPATERVFLDLSRQQQLKHELYVFLLQKKEETAISKTATVSNSRVIDPPKAAASPFSPKRSATLLAGLLIGLIVPSALIYFRELLDTKVRSKDEIKNQTSTPIIGEIIRSRYKNTLVVNQHSRSAIAEQFRTLRTNLAFYLTDPTRKVILLTSSMSGEGKSFIALNLATILSLSGKRVVLMEMDLRKPNISIKLDQTVRIGFTNYIIDNTLTPAEIVTASGVNDNLFLIGSGPIPPNPAEVLLNPRLGELMQHLKNQFDYIVVDAPPVGLVTDAQLLSPYADLTLYLVRQGYTHKNQLQIVDELFRNQKMKQLAILINDINPKASHGYGYGYGSSYGNGYYETDEAKKPWWKFRK
ncbi:GumC family protein [Parapedobacter sp. GCM10030251]|uniref:GumC family protein n=1 Tax=Parapedobacter sp. GCM10030251 TaxID=3273419 RepID=UPI00360D8916